MWVSLLLIRGGGGCLELLNAKLRAIPFHPGNLAYTSTNKVQTFSLRLHLFSNNVLCQHTWRLKLVSMAPLRQAAEIISGGRNTFTVKHKMTRNSNTLTDKCRLGELAPAAPKDVFYTSMLPSPGTALQEAGWAPNLFWSWCRPQRILLQPHSRGRCI